MRIYKPTYTKEGQLVESPTWWLDFKWKRRRCRLPGFTSQKQTESFGGRLEELMGVLASGQTPDASLSKWIQAQSPTIQQKMAAYELLDGRFAAAGKPLQDHLVEWHASLLAKGNTPYHAERYRFDTRRLLQLSRITYHSDLSPSRIQAALDELKQGTKTKPGLSLQTLNHALRAAKAFSRWMVADRRATEDPLLHMRGFNVRTDRRHDRRALSEEEVARLILATETGPSRFGVNANDRAMLYRLALGTGFRRNELATLTPASFDLERKPPTILILAGYSKHRREDVQPIRPDLAAQVRPWLKDRDTTRPLWGNLQRTSEMIQEDLEAARQAWVQEVSGDEKETHVRLASDFLLYRNSQGLVADFHALRHTFITRLVNSGAPMKATQMLARHSNPTLTLGRYVHAGILDTSKALDAMPAMKGAMPDS